MSGRLEIDVGGGVIPPHLGGRHPSGKRHSFEAQAPGKRSDFRLLGAGADERERRIGVPVLEPSERTQGAWEVVEAFEVTGGQDLRTQRRPFTKRVARTVDDVRDDLASIPKPPKTSCRKARRDDVPVDMPKDGARDARALEMVRRLAAAIVHQDGLAQ